MTNLFPSSLSPELLFCVLVVTILNFLHVIKATGLHILYVKCTPFRANMSVFAGVSEGGHSDEAVPESHAASDVLSGEQ